MSNKENLHSLHWSSPDEAWYLLISQIQDSILGEVELHLILIRRKTTASISDRLAIRSPQDNRPRGSWCDSKLTSNLNQ